MHGPHSPVRLGRVAKVRMSELLVYPLTVTIYDHSVNRYLMELDPECANREKNQIVLHISAVLVLVSTLCIYIQPLYAENNDRFRLSVLRFTTPGVKCLALPDSRRKASCAS